MKPKNKAELVEGSKRFWLTVVATKCQKYIQHLRKVIPRIIELMAMQLVTDLYYCGFVVFRVLAFTEQAHPFVVACLFLCIRTLLQIGEAML